MTDVIDRDFLRKLAEWSTDGAPVASLYLDVDGRRYPRRQDYLIRAEELCRRLKKLAEGLDRPARLSMEKDAERMLGWFQDLDRGPSRGVVLFSCSASELWEEVVVSRPLADRATVADHPHVLPLEALLETYETFCTVLVDREKARIFLVRMGRVHEESDVFDDVPGRHDQGGWSQGRYQRHIEDHFERHLKHVGEELFRFFKRKGFDQLILAGPDEVVAEFERGLHDYLKRRVVARATLSMTASTSEVLERALQVEEGIEVRREREVVEKVTAEAAAGRNAVVGLEPVLAALNDSRIDTLVVPLGLAAEGVRCVECGWLGTSGSICMACGAKTESVGDVVESAVEKAIRQSSRVETLTILDDRDKLEVGALLRY